MVESSFNIRERLSNNWNSVRIFTMGVQGPQNRRQSDQTTSRTSKECLLILLADDCRRGFRCAFRKVVRDFVIESVCSTPIIHHREQLPWNNPSQSILVWMFAPVTGCQVIVMHQIDNPAMLIDVTACLANDNPSLSWKYVHTP